MILARYILLLYGPEKSNKETEIRLPRVLADMPAYLEEAEENLNDLLPADFRVEIIEKS